jgi:hypothetical protein
MIKPFQIVIELIEFGLQALFVYILALIIIVGFLIYSLNTIPHYEYIEKEHTTTPPYTSEGDTTECKRPAGCRIREDGTVEY